jgi:hypothetical protein
VNLLRHRPVKFLLAVALLWAGWQAYLTITARQRLDTTVAAALAGGGLVNVAVTLGFAPEDFHLRIFQAHGVVSGVSGTTVLLNRVKPNDVRQIARYYWVQRITPQRSPS